MWTDERSQSTQFSKFSITITLKIMICSSCISWKVFCKEFHTTSCCDLAFMPRWEIFYHYLVAWWKAVTLHWTRKTKLLSLSNDFWYFWLTHFGGCLAVLCWVTEFWENILHHYDTERFSSFLSTPTVNEEMRNSFIWKTFRMG